MTSQDTDSGIPLLTEVMPFDDEMSTGVQTASGRSPMLLLEVSIPELTAPYRQEPAWSEQDLARMQAEISDRITRQVLRQLDIMLEERVRDSLADVLQLAVSGLAQGIRRDLKQTLEEAISRAVAQEIPGFQTKNNPL
ncbi:MAG: hypothetical protein ACI9ZF_000249 [Bradyrhizobium sp.]|jgi:hypothetical protein